MTSLELNNYEIMHDYNYRHASVHDTMVSSSSDVDDDNVMQLL